MDNLLFLDYETYYDAQYSLGKMTTPQYIKDERFKIHCCSFAEGLDGEPFVLRGQQAIADYMATIDWANTTLVAHNTQFDGAITNWILGHRPARYVDTMAMFKYFFPGRASLAQAAKTLGLRSKGTALESTKGLWEIPDDIWPAFEEYAIDDVAISRDMYRMFIDHIPDREMVLIHVTMKMFIEPKIVIDRDLLAVYIGKLQEDLAGLREEAYQFVSEMADTYLWDGVAIDDKLFTSNKRFVDLLERLDIDVPYKYRPATEHEIKTRKQKAGDMVKTPALAKGDEQFLDLVDRYRHMPEGVVFEMRLALKSRIEETRATRFRDISAVMDGKLPVPLRYFGAKTGRWSGADKVNLQNLSARGNTKVLRESLQAPKGYKLVVADLKQIEPRVLATLAGAETLVEGFRSGKDFYSTLYGTTFSVDADELFAGYEAGEKWAIDMRNVGKGMGLGLGYGMGFNKFQGFAKVMAKREFTLEESKAIVGQYRRGNPEITRFWQNCDQVLFPMSSPAPMEPEHFNGVTAVNQPFPIIKMPSGNFLKYPNLRALFESNSDTAPDGYEFGINGSYSKIYGGLMVENIVQALSRDILGDMIYKLESAGLMNDDEGIVNLVHDEIVLCVREDRAEMVGNHLKKIMSTPPTWFQQVPLGCSLDIADNYAEAK